MRKVLIFVSLVCLVVAGSALAMDPNPNLKQLAPFAKNYKCSGTAFANEMSPEHPTSASVMGDWTLDGMWVRFSYIETKTAKNSMPAGVRGFFGYDPEMKKFVLGGVDNMGGYSGGHSDGWSGDSIVFEGPWHLGSQTVQARDTFTKTAKGLHHTGEMMMDGKWMKYGEEDCTFAK
ncbi:MAG: hypothetical protein DMF56_21375 [Acidobacteria bacterium]|nr:MAG: hypothetical protein DMF56_21375 [Acidobacteriota bacterium]